MTTPKTVKRQRPKPAKFWIGLGASAGGLEALRGLVRNLPPNLSATYIVAQHMAPHHKSMLSEIIGRETDMRVLDVTNDLSPKANTIYITPPNKNIVVEGNVLRLVEPSKEPAAPKPSVDLFFRTLAKEKRELAIGIILSGTGSDGAKGIGAIRAAGGITIAQDELTAKYSGMPIAAMETGLVDLVMSPEEIGAQIPKITKLPRNLDDLKASPLNLTGISELVQLLMDQTKVNFKHYKTATFQRRVERRMAATKTATLDDYVNIARASNEEVQLLFKDLLISVTSFFRDQVEFDALRPHIAKIIADRKGDPIRVWVPGTATGEEAYSLAMLFIEAAQSVAIETIKLQVFATDIDTNAIEIARRGFYGQTSLEQVPQDFIRKYFDRAPTGFTVKKSLREKMVFSYHNVAQDPPFLNIDMISCRNLLIYFQASLQAEVFSRFHYSLVPNGLLFLGKAEAVSASEALFRAATHDKHIFYQRPSHQRQPPRDMAYQRPAYVSRGTAPYIAPDLRELTEARARFDSLVAAMGPNALLINGAMQLERVYGDVGRYVTVAAGSVDTRVSTLIREPYRADIQSSAPSVMRNKKTYQGVARADPTQPGRRERVAIYPIEAGKNEDVAALVVFSEWLEEPKRQRALASDSETESLNRQIDDLSNELSIAKTNLQQTVEELEASNEELQALNEELQSSNEELQSTNEELETSNEELQSTNEELSTVNEELQVNSQQLNIVNQSLSSILDNIAVPMLVVDRSLTITQASRGSEKFFGVAADFALPHVSRCQMRPGYPDLVVALNEAMTLGKPQDFYIDHGNENAIMKIVPHVSVLGDMVGAIVLVNDNTEELQRTRKELQLIFDNVPAAIMVRGTNGKIFKANIAARKLLGVTGDGPVGTSYSDYFDDESAADTARLDRQVFETGQPLTNIVRRVKYKKGDEIWVRESLIPAKSSENNDLLTYVMKQNITEQHLAEMSLKESQVRLDQAVKASKIGLWEWDIAANRSFLSDRLKEIVDVADGLLSFTIADFTARVHPEDRAQVDEARRRHFEERAPYEVVYRIRRGDGRHIWIRSFGQAAWDEANVPFRFTGTMEDITKQRENLLELREQKEQLELAASLSGVGQWKLDVLTNAIYWSSQSYLIHGVNRREYKPTVESATSFYHPDDQETVRSHLATAIKTAGRLEFEARIIRGDHVMRIVRSVGIPNIDEHGQVTGILGSFQDVTESREREAKMISTLNELARSNEELNRFSYVCSHDMKEPVRMIESMAALLMNRDFDANEKVRTELLSRISVNTSRLRAIIDGLLAYSRIEAKIEVRDVDLNIILTDIRDGLSLAVADQSATIEMGPLPVVRGATVHFTQLFHNLIGNALKYSDKAQPLIRLSARDIGTGWVFLVEDNGPGVPEASRREIFKLFSRLKRRDEVEGTGLGLSIAQRIVEQYHGTIICLSSALGGAAFEIFLPHPGGPHDA